jgi:single-stranded DNA-binding protein
LEEEEMIKQTIIGRIGKIDNKGKIVLLSIAVNESEKVDGEWMDKTIWKNLVAFSGIAEKVTKYNKGDLLYVEAAERPNSYENSNGELFESTQLVVVFVKRLQKNKSQNSEGINSEGINSEGINSDNDDLPF